MPTDARNTETILADAINNYQDEYYRQTGERLVLRPADSARIELYTVSYMFSLAYQYINYCRLQNLIDYAQGNYLDSLGALLGVTRLDAAPATTSILFQLSAAQPGALTIPGGTRISPGNQVYFTTAEPLTIPSGAMQGIVLAHAITTGADGNGYLPGQLNTLVDPQPYIASVANLETTQGGSAIEDDEHLRTRVKLKPYSFSTAGPAGAYEYWVLSYDKGGQAIENVLAYTPAPGQVTICLLLENGEPPSPAFIQGLYDYLEDYRPMTDNLTIRAPGEVSYSINLTYYIKTTDENRTSAIQDAVQTAIDTWVAEMAGTIGLNISPNRLIQLCKEAGAVRIEISEPSFIVVNEDQVAANDQSSNTIIYGGLEDA